MELTRSHVIISEWISSDEAFLFSLRNRVGKLEGEAAGYEQLERGGVLNGRKLSIAFVYSSSLLQCSVFIFIDPNQTVFSFLCFHGGGFEEGVQEGGGGVGLVDWQLAGWEGGGGGGWSGWPVRSGAPS